MLIRKNQIIVFQNHVPYEGTFYVDTYKAKVEFKVDDIEEEFKKKRGRKYMIDFLLEKGLIKPFDVYEWEI